MGKDIDRNITRQLWERLKNTFSRNDIIPVKNGGTGASNGNDALINITNSSSFVDVIQNTYKNPNLSSIIEGRIYINTNSIFIDFYGNVNIVEERPDNTYIACAINNIESLKGRKIDFIFSQQKSHLYIDDGTITITFQRKGTDSFNANFMQRFVSLI